jgi:flagellar biosynthesis/type III secretory pathway chaperone
MPSNNQSIILKKLNEALEQGHLISANKIITDNLNTLASEFADQKNAITQLILQHDHLIEAALIKGSPLNKIITTKKSFFTDLFNSDDNHIKIINAYHTPEKANEREQQAQLISEFTDKIAKLNIGNFARDIDLTYNILSEFYDKLFCQLPESEEKFSNFHYKILELAKKINLELVLKVQQLKNQGNFTKENLIRIMQDIQEPNNVFQAKFKQINALESIIQNKTAKLDVAAQLYSQYEKALYLSKHAMKESDEYDEFFVQCGLDLGYNCNCPYHDSNGSLDGYYKKSPKLEPDMKAREKASFEVGTIKDKLEMNNLDINPTNGSTYLTIIDKEIKSLNIELNNIQADYKKLEDNMLSTMLTDIKRTKVNDQNSIRVLIDSKHCTVGFHKPSNVNKETELFGLNLRSRSYMLNL